MFLTVIMPQENLSGRKLAMIIASRDFRDEEYFLSKKILELAGFEIKTFSNQTGLAIGADGGEVNVGFNLETLNVSDFDAIIFIGGPGALKYLDNEISYKVVREAIFKDKVLAAICSSPIVLARAGVLKEKKVTVWSGALDKSPLRILSENEAIYQDSPVVADGKIITANGPEAAEIFAEKIIEVLK